MMRPHLSICNRCLGRSRLFSTTASKAGIANNAALPPDAGYAQLTNRGLISITGIDSATFLQGLMTQNMLVANDPNKPVRRTGTYTAFLNSQGRILNDAFIYPVPMPNGNELEWLVEVDKSEVPILLKHLKKHKLRAKLKLRALEDGERTVWSSWKNHEQPRWAAYNLESDSTATSPFTHSSDIIGCIDTRAPGFGSRIITPGSEDLRTHFPDESELAGSQVGLDAYTVRRILNGVPEGQSEIIRESALPMECNMDMARAIDFRKGCYVGQELTIRTHHTGVVRKRILPVQLYTQEMSTADGPVFEPSAEIPSPPVGTNIMKAGGRRGRSAGKFLNSVGNIGLALCRLEMMTDIALTGEGTQYTPGSEFKLSWTSELDQPVEVKLQAFVPSWLREHIQTGGVRKATARPVDTDGERARDFVEQLEEEEEQAHRRAE
ncbi:transferase caf17 [Penicillium longicatenatum]|uniref:transferase caf17 n=1 Tax=Penicillium longicatenatum TaxID=1561947 RepID=UPI0025467DBC|nr:transferase caf17 [Penicillium longicatenatum]KAJ5636127.1 transferase caf17 [Penicillium longicatenatum]